MQGALSTRVGSGSPPRHLHEQAGRVRFPIFTNHQERRIRSSIRVGGRPSVCGRPGVTTPLHRTRVGIRERFELRCCRAVATRRSAGIKTTVGIKISGARITRRDHLTSGVSRSEDRGHGASEPSRCWPGPGRAPAARISRDATVSAMCRAPSVLRNAGRDLKVWAISGREDAVDDGVPPLRAAVSGPGGQSSRCTRSLSTGSLWVCPSRPRRGPSSRRRSSPTSRRLTLLAAHTAIVPTIAPIAWV